MHCNIALKLTNYYRKKRHRAEYGVAVFLTAICWEARISAISAPATPVCRAFKRLRLTHETTATHLFFARSGRPILPLPSRRRPAARGGTIRSLRCGNPPLTRERAFDLCDFERFIVCRNVSTTKHPPVQTRQKPRNTLRTSLPRNGLRPDGTAIALMPRNRIRRNCKGHPDCGNELWAGDERHGMRVPRPEKRRGQTRRYASDADIRARCPAQVAGREAG